MRSKQRSARIAALRTRPPKMPGSAGAAALASAIMLALGLVAPADAKVFLVTREADSGAGTLRQAAHDAAALGGQHKIRFALPANMSRSCRSSKPATRATRDDRRSEPGCWPYG